MKIMDLTGEKFNRLTVLERVFIKRKDKTYWKCLCDCSNIVEVVSADLRYGTTKSCGCYNVYINTVNKTKHDLSFSKEYKAWSCMIQRCCNPKNKNYEEYAGRGITVCDQWKDSFENFYKDMGPKPSDEHSLDRIDNSGSYEPGNCRWATKTEQTNNRNVTLRTTYQGKEYLLSELAAKYNVGYFNLRDRLRRGMDIDTAMNDLFIISKQKTNEAQSEVLELLNNGLTLDEALYSLFQKINNLTISIGQVNFDDYNVIKNYTGLSQPTPTIINIKLRQDGSFYFEE